MELSHVPEQKIVYQYEIIVDFNQTILLSTQKGSCNSVWSHRLTRLLRETTRRHYMSPVIRRSSVTEDTNLIYNHALTIFQVTFTVCVEILPEAGPIILEL